MCGIFGTVNFNISEDTFKSRLDLLKHRGPDGFGVWSSDDQCIRIGHRRLAIIDKSKKADQPMLLNDRYIFSFNGEVYNYIELRNDLTKEGVAFTTNSDTEVLLKLLIKKGPEALNLINGVWAFVLYDKQENSLLISRDRIGEKPLYFINKNNQLAFASEMKSLYNCLDQFNYNSAYINKCINNLYGSNAAADTIVENISMFPAGYYAYYKEGALDCKQYYFPKKLLEQKPYIGNLNEATDEFLALFKSSCQLRMRSDVPIGSSLSGGIDSGLVLSTISRFISKNNYSHTGVISSFPNSILDETELAIKIAKNTNANYLTVKVNPDYTPNQLLKSVYDFEDISGTSSLPFYQTYQAFRNNNIIVTLDGHGGDELFGGYSFDLPSKISDDFPNLFKIQNTLQTIENMNGNKKVIKMGLAWLYLKQEFNKRKEDPDYDENNSNNYAKKLHQSTFSGILPSLLNNYDKYSMQAGVEIRMPFLDYRIIEFAFKLPNHFKINNGFSKVLLRKASVGLLPNQVINNKLKLGWNSPMGEWFDGIWKEWILDEINSIDFINCTLINPKEITNMVQSFILKGDKDQHTGQMIWLKLQPYLIQKANKLFHQYKD